jgi:pyruvate kinase
LDSYLPRRSEISDITQMVIDGAYGVLLAKETSNNIQGDRIVDFVKSVISSVIEYQNEIKLTTLHNLKQHC